jgi:hypothetical protein
MLPNLDGPKEEDIVYTDFTPRGSNSPHTIEAHRGEMRFEPQKTDGHLMMLE